MGLCSSQVEDRDITSPAERSRVQENIAADLALISSTFYRFSMYN